jgi:tetratricopeptide (TPR) repeat protein
MPFGKKPGPSGAVVDFDAVYRELIAPGVEQAGMDPLRADEELAGGVIHKPMFERLILCEYAVADLTTANANVFYELGVRHALRPWSTVLLFAEGGGQLPFDVAPLRAIPYRLTPDGLPRDTPVATAALARQLQQARGATTDSPVFQLVEGLPVPDVAHMKTDVFRDRVRYSAELKGRLEKARGEGVGALRAVEAELGAIADAEAGVVVDLFLSYRAVQAWGEVIALAAKMSPPLAATVLVREQLAMALNRAGRGEEAETVLTQLIGQRGASSETCGILGRVYKDRWERARNAGNTYEARGLLEKAIDAYLKGFEADWRDPYPGVNACTLMEIREPPDPRRERIVPVVAYAAERRIAAGERTGGTGYWDYATRLELAVLAGDEPRAADALGRALASARESWVPETTARNLRLIREARELRGAPLPWAGELEAALEGKKAELA